MHQLTCILPGPQWTSTNQLNCLKAKSNSTHLVLKDVFVELSGKYFCEVSADAPSFRTAQNWGQMNVVVLPPKLPEILGLKSRYRVDDHLKVHCISNHSRPGANLTWSLNGALLDSEYVVESTVTRPAKSEVEFSQSTLNITLQRHHFFGSRLKLRCTASIFDIYWKSSEYSAEEDKSPETKGDAREYRLPEKFIKAKKHLGESMTRNPNESSKGILNYTVCKENTIFIISIYIFIINVFF